MLRGYRVLCSRAGCTSVAIFKIAAAWSDGTTHELKTYHLACEACLSTLFAEAIRKQQACRLAAGETLGRPAIFITQGGLLVRQPELEVSETPS